MWALTPAMQPFAGDVLVTYMATEISGFSLDLKSLTGSAMPSNKNNITLFATWIATAIVIFLADQFTKVMIIGNFQLGDSQPVFQGWFNLVRAHNTGAAFSFMASADGWQRWLFTGIGLVAAILIIFLLKSNATQKLFAFALTLILGGAIGNVFDRIMYGYVIDFLDFYWSGIHFPAFNLADSAITLGAICLFIDEMLRVKKSKS
jgi:signal peptidase II